MIQVILFDFGGCLDAPGVHSRTLFWDAFLKEGLIRAEDREFFQNAYTEADQKMMSTGIAKNLALKEFNRMNGSLIAEFTKIRSPQIAAACDSITAKMSMHLQDVRPILFSLKKSFSLGIISNFTGNLEVILEEFGIKSCFSSITESFYVGASKPDKKIFEVALSKHLVQPNEILFVGDNPVNDIAPAHAMGLKTALIYRDRKRECEADFFLRDLSEIPALIHSA